jgi:drug/metabolite transporter (DMT)-like permease
MSTDWILPTVVTLVSGTVSGVASKALYSIEGTGDCDSNNNPPSTGHFFAKPYFSVLTMFIGEALCLVIYFLMKWNERRKKRDSLLSMDYSDSADQTQVSNQPNKVPKWIFGILASFDTCGTACVSVGLLYVSASIYQMLRGSAVVFVACFSIWILKVRLTKKQWIGVGIVVIGLIAVGLSAVLGGGGDDEQTSVFKQILGIILILFGTALNSLQNVVEEKLLKLTGGAESHPLEVVGWEGVWGIGISSFLLLPIVAHIPGPDCGAAEDTLDTLHMLSQSGLIVGLVVSYIIGLLLLNSSSMEVSRVLTAVHRNLVNALRTILLWAVEVVAHWIWPDSPVIGEKLTWYSLIQLFGFICLIIGTLVYGKGKTEAAMKSPLDAPEIEETYRGAEGLEKVAGAYEDGSVNGHGDL